MGRPSKYKNEAERNEARRRQTREHVKKHRAAKKAHGRDKDKHTTTRTVTTITTVTTIAGGLGSLTTSPETHDDASSTSSTSSDGAWIEEDAVRRFSKSLLRSSSWLDEDETIQMLSTANPEDWVDRCDPSPCDTDMASHSAFPIIDLSFGAGAHITNLFVNLERAWPWQATLDYEKHVGRPAGRLAEAAVFAAGTSFAAFKHRSKTLGLTRITSMAYTLQQLRKWLDTGNWAPVLGPVLSTTIHAVWGMEIVQVSAAKEHHNAWLWHLRGGFQVMTFAGPKAYANPSGMAIFRALQPRLMSIAYADRKDIIQSPHSYSTWYGTILKHETKSPLDKLFHVISGTVRYLENTDLIKIEMAKTQRNGCMDRKGLRGALDCVLVGAGTVRRSFIDWLAQDAPPRHQDGRVDVTRSKNVFELPEFTANLMPSCHKYATYREAIIMMTYWQYYLRTLSLIKELQDLIDYCTPEDPSPVVQRQAIWKETGNCIQYICWSLECIYDSTWGVERSWEALMFNGSQPLRLVIRMLESDDTLLYTFRKEYKWSRAVAEQLLRPGNGNLYTVGEHYCDAILGPLEKQRK